MAKDTLLEIVQDILSDSDGDNVNAISDTVEATQCATIIRNEFLDIVDNMDLSHHKQVRQLTATGSSTPNVMTRPEGFHDIAWIKYDKKTDASADPAFNRVYWMEPEEFINMMTSLNASDSNVGTTTLDTSVVLNHYNDRAPMYYTILEGYDDIIFDAYDSDLETNLQTSKSMAYGVQRPTLTIADATVPDLPQDLMQLLKNRSRAMFFDLYKDGVTREVDRKQRRSEVRAQRLRHIANQNRRRDQRRTPDYGRK